MRLSIAAILTTSIIHPVALAALTVNDVVTNIGIVTNVSVKINNVLTPLSTSTTDPDVVSLGQFTVIINNLSADITAMQATPPFTVQADCDAIVIALDSFVEVHQALLATVISKHAIFAQFAVTAPIAAVLRTLEVIIDSFAFAMIDLIPCGAGSVTNDKNGLDITVENSITLYTEVCVPSPLYPTVLPICI
ncbi:hypothetical protein DFH08DRAFT_820287 [Mycena albidolilacea]|uniref:Uncharacterized protein n=1 Tax=Mycena albidolilacea TaxID=1033008 RepID=A0AAD7EF85_9AGAR|nr:hypothetical protein DFH08DRAFT_820287 [Mycena albidolilacea]